MVQRRTIRIGRLISTSGKIALPGPVPGIPIFNAAAPGGRGPGAGGAPPAEVGVLAVGGGGQKGEGGGGVVHPRGAHPNLAPRGRPRAAPPREGGRNPRGARAGRPIPAIGAGDGGEIRVL